LGISVRSGDLKNDTPSRAESQPSNHNMLWLVFILERYIWWFRVSTLAGRVSTLEGRSSTLRGWVIHRVVHGWGGVVHCSCTWGDVDGCSVLAAGRRRTPCPRYVTREHQGRSTGSLGRHPAMTRDALEWHTAVGVALRRRLGCSALGSTVDAAAGRAEHVTGGRSLVRCHA
jgi:hypothetical protein